MARVLSLARYSIVLGVLSSLILSVAIVIASAVHAATSIVVALSQLGEPKTAKQLAVSGIEVVDFLLISTVLYITATGLYELFIGDVNLPAWVSVTSLNDLKDKLLSVIVVVLAVTFLIHVANWDGTANLLPFGASIAAVVLALTAFSLISRNATRAATKSAAPPDEAA